jgi:hypothetical protein
MELSDEYSEETCFRILPCFSFEKENQGFIYDTEMVYIVSTLDQSSILTGEPYVHASKPVSSRRHFLQISTCDREGW